jgi:hypothetical protein
MKIKRFDIGFWRRDGKIICCKPFFEYFKADCGCYLLTIGPISITWLGDECND